MERHLFNFRHLLFGTVCQFIWESVVMWKWVKQIKTLFFWSKHIILRQFLLIFQWWRTGWNLIQSLMFTRIVNALSKVKQGNLQKTVITIRLIHEFYTLKWVCDDNFYFFILVIRYDIIIFYFPTVFHHPNGTTVISGAPTQIVYVDDDPRLRRRRYDYPIVAPMFYFW